MQNQQALQDKFNQQQIERALARIARSTEPQLVPALRKKSTAVLLGSGENLFRQGEPGDAIYFVVRGRLRVMLTDANGNVHQVNEIGKNESVGEIALFSENNRTATVVAMRDSLLLKLERDDFDSLSQRWPKFALAVSRQVINRLGKTLNAAPGDKRAVVLSLVGAHDVLSLDTICDQLAAALERHGSVLVIEENTIDGILGHRKSHNGNPISLEQTAAEVDEQEYRYRFIIYKTTHFDTPWTRQCVRLCEKVLLIDDREHSHGNYPQAPLFAELGKQWQLVHVRQHYQQPLCDYAPCANLPHRPRHHHFVALDSVADVQRLARFVAGRAIGLVLAGGGARGLGHLGVLKALNELKIPIDYVGGTSIGAIIGGLIAMDLRAEDILDAARQGFVDDKPLSDWSIPRVALLRGNRLNRILVNYFSDVTIEQLKINYFCVSADLETSETMVHTNGKLWQAVRASISLPGILPPVALENRLLIDGGCVNNLPVDLMIEQGVGHTIAVDLISETDQAACWLDCSHLREEMSAQTTNQPYQQATQQTPEQTEEQTEGQQDSPTKLPNMLEIIIRSSLIASSQKSRENSLLADTYLQLPVEQFGLLEFKRFDDIVNTGYKHAILALKQSHLTNTL